MRILRPGTVPSATRLHRVSGRVHLEIFPDLIAFGRVFSRDRCRRNLSISLADKSEATVIADYSFGCDDLCGSDISSGRLLVRLLLGD